MYQTILVNTKDQITTISFNRPAKRNALNGEMVKEISLALSLAETDQNQRIVIIKGEGQNFCAGADIAWMKELSKKSQDENFEDANLLAQLFYQLYTFPKPTITLAHGPSFGGALGFVSASDISLAADDVRFGFLEVKIGITPSTISPYVIADIGERAAHYYFLTGEQFGGEDAKRMNLVSKVVNARKLDEEGYALAHQLLHSSPNAISEIKYLIQHVAKELITPDLTRKTAEHLARVRKSPEAKEGLQAFLDKRSPSWS